jgi:hypothetical protein
MKSTYQTMSCFLISLIKRIENLTDCGALCKKKTREMGNIKPEFTLVEAKVLTSPLRGIVK